MLRFARQPSLHQALIVVSALSWTPLVIKGGLLSDNFSHLVLWARPPWDEALAWFAREKGGGFYRPITALTWKLAHTLFGFESAGYRLLLITLHTACAIVLYRLCRSLKALSLGACAVATLSFQFLPGHVFSVFMVSAVSGVLYAPGEIGSAPVFGGPWGLRGALSLLGCSCDYPSLAMLRGSAPSRYLVEVDQLGDATIRLRPAQRQGFFRMANSCHAPSF